MHGVRAVTSEYADVVPQPVVRHPSASLARPYESQLAFTRSNIECIPADAKGVYAIWFRKRCIYVGLASQQSIARRLRQHWEQSHNEDLALWIRAKGSALTFNYQSLDDPVDIQTFEHECIRRFQPVANKTN